jgi:hypothetical protein
MLVAVLGAWWTNREAFIADEGWREAAMAARAGAWVDVAFCSLGGEPELLKYYLERPFIVPTSATELLELSATGREVRCVYWGRGWEPPEHTAIARWLEENGTSTRIKEMIVLTYRS